jgi:hypothetical protein
MRPTLLRPNQRVAVDDGFGQRREMVFLRRDRQPCRPAVNYFQCDAFIGLYGAGDKGVCTMTDYRVSRFVFSNGGAK